MEGSPSLADRARLLVLVIDDSGSLGRLLQRVLSPVGGRGDGRPQRTSSFSDQSLGQIHFGQFDPSLSVEFMTMVEREFGRREVAV